MLRYHRSGSYGWKVQNSVGTEMGRSSSIWLKMHGEHTQKKKYGLRVHHRCIENLKNYGAIDRSSASAVLDIVRLERSRQLFRALTFLAVDVNTNLSLACFSPPLFVGVTVQGYRAQWSDS